MRARTLVSLALDGRLGLLRSVGGFTLPHYRAAFLVAAAKSGLLAALRGGPLGVPEIARVLAIDGSASPALVEWLSVGEAVGVLRRHRARWTLSAAGKLLASERGDPLVALLDEMIELHTRVIVEAPGRLAHGPRFTIWDLDAEVVARSSRLVAPFIAEAVEAFVPRRGAARLLEIGCGSGVHLRVALARNPELTAVGLERSPRVAAAAAESLRAWGLMERARVETRDVWEEKPGARYDLATLHQNIYYFPEAEQVRLLSHVRSLLTPGGRLLLTTFCRGGSAAVGVLSLWGALTEGCSPLPEPAALARSLAAAGYRRIARKNLLAPLDRFFSFTATA